MATPSNRTKRTAAKQVATALLESPTMKPAQTKKEKKKTGAKRKAKSAPAETIALPGIVVEQESDKEVYWEVEAVVGRKKMRGKDYFKIRWKGCSAEQDTWEPETNLADSALQEALAFKASETKEKQAQKKAKEADVKQVTTTPAVTSEVAQLSVTTNDEAKPKADTPAVDAAVDIPMSKPEQEKVKEAALKQVPATPAVTPEAVQVSGAKIDEAKPETDLPEVFARVDMPVSQPEQGKVKEAAVKQVASTPAVTSEAEQVSVAKNDEAKPEADMPAVEAAMDMQVSKPDQVKVRKADVKQVAATAVTSEAAQVSGARIGEAKPEAVIPDVYATVEIAASITKKATKEGKKVAAKSILPVPPVQDSDAKNDKVILEAATSAVDAAAKMPAVSNVS